MRTIRLLLVDDNREYLEAATALLKSQPEIEIVGSALTGQEALELVPQTHPDVVLLDLLMPEMNGLEVAKRLKAEANPPRIIIVTLEDQNVFQEVATDRKSTR